MTAQQRLLAEAVAACPDELTRRLLLSLLLADFERTATTGSTSEPARTLQVVRNEP